MRTTVKIPFKHDTTIEKYRDGDDPNDPNTKPYEVSRSSGWYEIDGRKITDPARIAQLERDHGQQPDR